MSWLVDGECPCDECNEREQNEGVEAEHYQGSVECIDAMRSALGDRDTAAYCRGAAFKYLWRADKKGQQQSDLNKAAWYIRMELHITHGQEDPRSER